MSIYSPTDPALFSATFPVDPQGNLNVPYVIPSGVTLRWEVTAPGYASQTGGGLPSGMQRLVSDTASRGGITFMVTQQSRSIITGRCDGLGSALQGPTVRVFPAGADTALVTPLASGSADFAGETVFLDLEPGPYNFVAHKSDGTTVTVTGSAQRGRRTFAIATFPCTD